MVSKLLTWNTFKVTLLNAASQPFITGDEMASSAYGEILGEHFVTYADEYHTHSVRETKFHI